MATTAVIGAAGLTGVRRLDLVPWSSSVRGPYALEFVDDPSASIPGAPDPGNAAAATSTSARDRVEAATPGSSGAVAARPTPPLSSGPAAGAAVGAAAGSAPPTAPPAPPTSSSVPADSRGEVQVSITAPSGPSTTTTRPSPSTTTTPPTSAPGDGGNGGDGGGSFDIVDTVVLRKRVATEIDRFGVSEILVLIDLRDVAGASADVVDQARTSRVRAVMADVGLPAERVVKVGTPVVTFIARLVSLAEFDALVAAPYVLHYEANDSIGVPGSTTTSTTSTTSTPATTTSTTSTASTTSPVPSTTVAPSTTTSAPAAAPNGAPAPPATPPAGAGPTAGDAATLGAAASLAAATAAGSVG